MSYKLDWSDNPDDVDDSLPEYNMSDEEYQKWYERKELDAEQNAIFKIEYGE